MEAWKKKAPQPGEPTMKKVDGKPFHWCVHHMCWANHTSEESQLGKKQAAQANSATTATDAANDYISNTAKAPSAFEALCASYAEAAKLNL